MSSSFISMDKLLYVLLCVTLVGCGDCESTPPGNTSDGQDMRPAPDASDETHDMDSDLAIEDANPDMPDVFEDVLPPVVMISSSTTSQPDGSYTLTGTAVDNIAVTDLFYTIDGGDPEALSLSQDGFSATLDVSAPIRITVTATDAAGNQSMQSIDVSPPPFELMAAFTIEGMSWLHEPLVFDASEVQMPDEGELTFTWDFGDGNTAQGVSLAHAFHTAEALTVTLTVTAEDGRTATAERDLTIAAPMPQGTTTISGYVTDESGFAMPGVDIFLATDPDTSLGRTDLRGRYEIELGTGMTSMVQFAKRGWATQLQRLELPAGTLSGSRDVSMRRIGEQIIVGDLTTATSIVRPDGLRIELPAQPFVYADDAQPVQGQALIEITPITPVDGEVTGFPGSFQALRQGFMPSTLATHGAVEVTLSQGGEKLQLAPGVEATLEIPLGTDAAIGEVIDLWSLDPRNGYWIWEGTGEVASSAMNNNIKVLRAQVSHFSVWNADQPLPMRDIQVTVNVAGGALEGPVNDLTVKTTATTEEGAVVNDTVTVNQGLSQDPGAANEVNALVPIDHNARIEIGSEEGCLYGSTEIEPGQGRQADITLKRSGGPLSQVNKLTPGEPYTVEFEALEKARLVNFDEVPGQYWRLTARALGTNDSAYIAMLAGCGGTSVARLPVDEAVGAATFVIEPGPSDERALVVQRRSLGAKIELLIEPLNAPAAPSDGTLSQRQNITWQDLSVHDSWVYMNQGQVAHLVVSDTGPQNANITLVTPSGEQRSPINTPFTPLSRIFTASESGWHLLALDPQEQPSSAQQYDLVIGEVFPEQALTFRPGYTQPAYTDRVMSLGAGDIQRYIVQKPGDQVLFVHPRLEPGSVATKAPRIGGSIVSTLAPDESISGYALAEQSASNFEIEFFVLTPELAPLEYSLDVNMIARDQRVVRVGDAPCLDVDTTSFMLGIAALQEGGTLELCGDRTYEAFNGANLRKKGIRIEGVPINGVRPTLRSWPGSTFVQPSQRNLVALSDLHIELDGAGLELQLDDLNHGAFQIERVSISGQNLSTTPTLRLKGRTSLDWAQASMPAIIDELAIDVTSHQGLRLEDISSLTVSNVTIQGADTRGFYASNLSGSTFSNLTIEDAVQAFEITGLLSYDNHIDGIVTRHSGTPAIPTSSTSSITLQDFAPAGSPMDQVSSSITDANVLLAHEGQTGITFRNSGPNPTSMTMQDLFINGASTSGTTGIELIPSANGSTFSIVNAIVSDTTLSAIEASSAQRFVEAIIAHSTLVLGDPSVSIRRDLVKLVNASASTLATIVNTIFVGPAQSLSTVTGANIYDATTSGTLRHNLFHQITHPYSSQNIVPFISPDAATDLLANPLFSNSMYELDPMSPAIDAGMMNNFAMFDYLGVMRPQGGAPDIGAYEQ